MFDNSVADNCYNCRHYFSEYLLILNSLYDEFDIFLHKWLNFCLFFKTYFVNTLMTLYLMLYFRCA